MKPTQYQWRREECRAIENLNILMRAGRDIGMISKPQDSETDRNAWRCYAGLGHASRFLGHAWTKRGAQVIVETFCAKGTNHALRGGVR